MLIYNVVASVDAPLTWQDYNKWTYPYVAHYPPSSILWYPTLTMTKYKPLYKFFSIFLHLVPAILIDTALICVGQKPRYTRRPPHPPSLLPFSSQLSVLDRQSIADRWSIVKDIYRSNDLQDAKNNRKNYQLLRYHIVLQHRKLGIRQRQRTRHVAKIKFEGSTTF